MSLNDRYRALDAEAMTRFAADWLAEIRSLPPEPEDVGSDEPQSTDAGSALAGDAADDDGDLGGVGGAVVMMNFLAPPEQQWMFIRAAVALAATDDELGHIAAGPVEHLLSYHGDAWIAAVESEAARDPKFARMLTGVWRLRMTDDVWARVCAIRSRVTEPLDPGDS